MTGIGIGSLVYALNMGYEQPDCCSNCVPSPDSKCHIFAQFPLESPLAVLYTRFVVERVHLGFWLCCIAFAVPATMTRSRRGRSAPSRKPDKSSTPAEKRLGRHADNLARVGLYPEAG
jgi:hypothetical protein